MSDAFHLAAQRLYLATVKNADARAAHRAMPHCEWEGQPVVGNEGYQVNVHRNCAVTLSYEPRSEWCEPCRNRQPLFEAYHRAAHELGNAKRAFMRAGQSISPANAAATTDDLRSI